MAEPAVQITDFAVEPLTPTIGAEIGGVDMREPASDELLHQLRAALLEWKVIFFRDQDVTREQHIAFARRFGELEVHPLTPADQEHQEILRIVHDEKHRGAENAWHSDVTWRPEPSLGSILRAIEVPPVGGDTLFSDMYAAYAGLDEQMQRRICELTAEHDFLHTFGRLFPVERHAAIREEHPVQEHPVVRTHPETGRRGLYVNVAFTRAIRGLPKQESDELLRRLWAQAAIPEYQCRFRWRRNSVAFWDNRACQHYATSDYWPARRAMERVTICGDRPYL
jgi:taurine dioxygenase